MLSEEDIEILLSALDAWEKSPSTGQLVGTLIGAMFLPKDKAQENAEKEEREAEEKIKQRKYQAISIKAKLLTMMTAAVASDAAKFMTE